MPLRLRRVTVSLNAIGLMACVVAGGAVATRQPIGALVLAALAGVALVIVFQELGFGVLVAWIVLTGLLYPVLSIGATETQVSFDRVVVCGMGSWLLFRRHGGSWSPAARRLGAALVLLVVAYGLRAAFTTDYGLFVTVASNPRIAALNTWFDAIVLPSVLFFVVANYADTLGHCRRLAGAMAVAGASLGAIGVAQAVTGFELASLSGGSARFDPDIGLVRVSGPYTVPEVYCVVLLVCLAMTLWWMLERGRPAYVWGAAAIGLEVAGISVTLFRAALIGVIVILIAGFAVRPKRLARLLVVVTTVGVLLVLAAAPLQSNDVVAARLQNTENIKGRLATYEQSLAVFEREPLTGVGVGQFVNSQAFVPPLVVGGIEAVPSPHSSFFGLLAEQGVLGLVPFLLCLLAAWGLLAELRRNATERADVLLWSCLVGAALAYLVMSLTLTMLPYGPSNAFLAVALGVAAARTRTVQEAR